MLKCNVQKYANLNKISYFSTKVYIIIRPLLNKKFWYKLEEKVYVVFRPHLNPIVSDSHSEIDKMFDYNKL